jgi:hypothetical protein
MMPSNQKRKSLLADTWLIENIANLFSIISMLVIVLLLHLYDSQPIFQWHGASLNSFVSVFATISKALLLLAVSSCLGQWKFISFSQRKRKLIEFDTYDSASRGPKGGLKLLWQTRLRYETASGLSKISLISDRSLSAVGALITIFALAFDPFVQQVIGFKELQVPSQNSSSPTTMPRAFRYSEGILFPVLITSMLQLPRDSLSAELILGADINIRGTSYREVKSSSSFSMQAAVLSGLSNDLAIITQQIPVRCPSGSCQWDPYESLAVCSACLDVTQHLTNSTQVYTEDRPYSPQYFDYMSDNTGMLAVMGSISTLTLPNKNHVDVGYSPAAVFYGTSNRTETLSFKDNDTLLWSTSMIKQIGSSKNYTATECGLYYCIKNIESQVVNGTLLETSTFVPLPQSSGSWLPINSSIPDPAPGQLDSMVEYYRQDLQFGSDYNISQVAINGIGAQMRTIFNLDVTSIRENGTTGYYIQAQDRAHDQFAPPAMQALFESTDLSNTFNVLAHSMTNAMRIGDDNGTIVDGTTGVTVYQVRWVWISLPLAIVLGSCIFLVLTIFQQRHEGLPIWKSSSLAVLKCGAMIDSLLDDHKHVGGMEDKAANSHVSLFESESGESMSLEILCILANFFGRRNWA